MSTTSTEMQYLVTVNVGDRDCGVFDKKTGGDTVVAVSKHRPGGMQPEKSYRTLPTYSDVVVSRVLERDRDFELARWMQDHAGGLRMQVTEQPLDEDGNAWGTPMAYSGRLGPVKIGQTDSGSNNPRMFELTMFCETRS